MSRPTTPHPTTPVRPRPMPGPPRPRPSRALRDDPWFRIGIVAGAVGALLLVTHYFEPFLMLAALPTKSWRAATAPGRPAPQPLLRDADLRLVGPVAARTERPAGPSFAGGVR